MKPTMRLLTLLLACLLSACTSVSLIQENINDRQLKSNARYDALVHAIKTQPTLPAITELRQVTVLTTGYKANAANEEVQKQFLFEDIENENWALCLQKANEGLASNYASLNSHFGAMVCNIELGNVIQGQYHESVFNQLLEAILITGNGESIDTAFQVINIADRDAFVEFHALDLIKQSITRRDGQNYDVVTIYDLEKDEVFEWYFTQLK
jgi:hypothetical protein